MVKNPALQLLEMEKDCLAEGDNRIEFSPPQTE